MASLYNTIGSNKRKTWFLIFVFSILAVLVIGFLGIYLGMEPEGALIFGALFAIIYSLISFYISDKAVLTIAGAKQIKKEQAPEIYRIVENLAITAGVPTPKIYIIDDPSPNAFATGRDPEHASVAFTTGLLKLMNKQELEGITAHELSHIKNFDIRIMTIVVVLVGLIMLISEVILRSGQIGRNRSNKQGAGIVLIVGLVLGILSPLIAQVIKLSISRTREYLADHSGVLLTRYPGALASALEKIKNSPQALKRANHATAHLYISNPFGRNKKGKISWYARMFMTHPPIDERIKKLREFDTTG